MTTPIPTHEGFVPFHGHQIWYRIVGAKEAAGKLPLLCLHGGPGVPHDYLEPLAALAAQGRRVIFYDQLGCGNSDQPHNPALWTVDLFVEEVGVICRALGLAHVHLVGQSWGGVLAMEYALTQPTGVASLTLADSPASTPQWIAEADRLRADLPPEVQATLVQHESAGTTDDPAYEAAMMVYYRRHVCRMDPWPECLVRAFDKLAQNPEVYHTMWGPSEFFATGALKTWDIVHRLGEIRLPTLVLSGRYDEATPSICETVQRGIPNAEWVIFEQSAHLPHLEETDRFLHVLDQFLSRVEAQTNRDPI